MLPSLIHRHQYSINQARMMDWQDASGERFMLHHYLL
jgi:hypothetical protein